MKKIKLLLVAFTLFVACNKEEITYNNVYYDNYFSLNGDLYSISLTEGTTYTPISLNADTENDAYNTIMVILNSDYTITFEGEEYKSGRVYELRLDELSKDKQLEIVVTDNTSGKSYTSYIETYPDNLSIGEVTTKHDDLVAGYYYLSVGDYIAKINTDGDLIYYRESSTASEFNRTVIDEGLSTEMVYYSFLETIDSSEYQKVSYVGYTNTKCIVMNENYDVIDEVNSIMGNRFGFYNQPTECHHFAIIGHNHYLVSAYVFIPYHDITTPSASNVHIVSAAVQEIKDGVLKFDWWSVDHEELNQYSDMDLTNYQRKEYWADYCHFNSVAIDPEDGNMVMSFRQLSAIVKVKRGHNSDGDGSVLWVLSGKGDNTNLGTVTEDQKFWRQHDIKFTGDNEFTFFANNTNTSVGIMDSNGSLSQQTNSESQQNAANMKFKIVADGSGYKIDSWKRYDGEHTSSMRGSTQELSKEGHYLMCWGEVTSGSLFTEYEYTSTNTDFGYEISATNTEDAGVKKLFELGLKNSKSSYRVYKHDK